jgi:hypothetical protein
MCISKFRYNVVTKIITDYQNSKIWKIFTDLCCTATKPFRQPLRSVDFELWNRVVVYHFHFQSNFDNFQSFQWGTFQNEKNRDWEVKIKILAFRIMDLLLQSFITCRQHFFQTYFQRKALSRLWLIVIEPN